MRAGDVSHPEPERTANGVAYDGDGWRVEAGPLRGDLLVTAAVPTAEPFAVVAEQHTDVGLLRSIRAALRAETIGGAWLAGDTVVNVLDLVDAVGPERVERVATGLFREGVETDAPASVTLRSTDGEPPTTLQVDRDGRVVGGTRRHGVDDATTERPRDAGGRLASPWLRSATMARRSRDVPIDEVVDDARVPAADGATIEAESVVQYVYDVDGPHYQTHLGTSARPGESDARPFDHLYPALTDEGRADRSVVAAGPDAVDLLDEQADELADERVVLLAPGGAEAADRLAVVDRVVDPGARGWGDVLFDASEDRDRGAAGSPRRDRADADRDARRGDDPTGRSG